MRISVRQLRRIINEAVAGEMGSNIEPVEPVQPVLMSLRKTSQGERPLKDYELEDMKLAGVVHMMGNFRSPKASNADPNIAPIWNSQNYVYKVPAHLVDAFQDAFPDAENAEDSFVKFVNQNPRAPNATRMFLRRNQNPRAPNATRMFLRR